MKKIGFSLGLGIGLASVGFAQGWQCYGGNAQHNGMFLGTSQSASLIQWQASLDDNRSYYGGEVLIHYAAPTVTPLNNVVYGYRYTSSASGVAAYDNWNVVARNGRNGAQLWSMSTDFSAVVIYPNDWTSVQPLTLFGAGNSVLKGVAAAGAGGTLLVRRLADSASSPVVRIPFYTSLTNYNQNKASFAPIKVNTPLSADNNGNIYFGYTVTGSIPSAFAALGTGGIAKVNVYTGAHSYVAAATWGIDSSMSGLALNAAPAITPDGKTIYAAVTGGNPWLVRLKASNLTATASVQIVDPALGTNAYYIGQSSASPMIGPDGHVFMGVFATNWRESHGWMVQYDADLNPGDSHGNRWPTGAFGWDDTATVVPANIVPSYTGTAKYLILTKYNNYDMGGDAGADGSNKVAVLDPTSNSVTRDRQSGIPVMNEVITVLGVTKTNGDSAHPDAVNEWCINSAAVDVARKGAIINSEDGHMYRWDFTTNSLTEGLNLQPATAEAYTMTAIGPDGQLYIINNAILFAVGSTKATSVSTYQGTHKTGTIQSIWARDANSYTASSTIVGGKQSAGVEGDFVLGARAPTTVNIAIQATAPSGTTGNILAYNFATKQFDVIQTGTFTGGSDFIQTSITTGASNYVSSTGQVRIVIQGTSSSAFTLGADQITSNAS